LQLTIAPASPSLIPTPPRTTETFLQARTLPSPVPASTASAKSEVLLQAIEALKASLLQTTTAGQEEVKAPAKVRRARLKKEPRCKFCGKSGHLIKDCKEAEEYILIGKCKQNMSGRIVLPSGAVAPSGTSSRTLQQRFDNYHQQNPGLQAAISRPPQDDAANQQSLGLQEARQATPAAAGAPPGPPAPEPKYPAANKVSVQPHSTELQAAPQVPKCTCPDTEAVPVPVAQQRTHRQLVNIIGACLSSSEHILKLRGPVQGMGKAVFATQEARHYSPQC
jgi:hypothetical protein